MYVCLYSNLWANINTVLPNNKPSRDHLAFIQAPDFFASRVALYTDKASPNDDSERSV